MQELRLVAVSEDGTYAVLAVPGRGGRFVLPIDDRLRTVARGQFSRLAQYEIEVENPLRPKEIQDRIRAGETADEIADAAGIPIDRVRRFEGPVLAEREYRAQEAQRSTVRGHTESGPGPRLGDIVSERLTEAGAAADAAAWDSRKRSDGQWQVQLHFALDGRQQLAEWVFDPRRRHVIPVDDLARRLCLPQVEWPAGRLGNLGAPTATVTPIGSRLGGPHNDARPEPDRVVARGHAPWAREAREPAWAREKAAPPAPSAGPPAGQEPARPAAGHPDTARPDTALPDSARPDTAPPDTTRGAGEPEPSRPDTQRPDTQRPAASQPAAGQPAASAARPAAHSATAEAAAGDAANGGAAKGTAANSPAPESTAPDSPAADSPAADSPAVDAPAADAMPAGSAAAAGGAGGRAEPGESASPAAESSPAAQSPAPPARSGRKSRNRRSSVPSWDEIMLGNSRQPD